MRSVRRLAIGIGAIVALLLLLLLAVPLLFRDRIAARVRAELATALDARVDWERVRLGVFRDFPNVTFGVDRPSVVGMGAFASDTLLTVESARLVLDLGSVVRHLLGRGAIVVREVAVDRPVVRLAVTPDGRASWDIVRPRTGGEGAGAIEVTLRELRVTDGLAALDDRRSRTEASIVGLSGTLAGDFARETFVLAVRARADSVSLRYAGVPWLRRVGLALHADVDADLRAGRYTFAHDTLRLNRLALAFAGTVTTGAPDLGLDLAFSTPSTAFADILSLVPAIYTRDFEELRTTGAMTTAGHVRGALGPAAFPSFGVRVRVADGSFRYPSLPLPARDIALDLAIDNPGGSRDSTVVRLERVHAVIGTRTLDGRLVLRTPASDPDVDLALRGSLDLADVARTVKLQGVSELRGVLSADLTTRARLSDVDARRYDRVAAAGALHVSRVVLRSTASRQPIALDTAALRFTPRAAELSALAARIGASDVSATGALDNLLGFVLRGDDLRGRASLRGERFDLAELIPAERTDGIVPVPDRLQLSATMSFGRVTYDSLVAERVRGAVRVGDERLTLDSLRMETLRGSVVASGFYETAGDGRPTFDAVLGLSAIDLPTAFTTVTTVRHIAPVARWARGTVSGTMRLRGPLDDRMTPVVSALGGDGDVDAVGLSLQGVPLLEALADALALEQLRRPTLGTVRMAYAIADGRVAVRPFAVRTAGIEMTVAGSHGLDQTLQYDLTLAIPRALLGGAAGGAVAKLAARVGKADELAGGDAVRLGAKVGGTVTSPTLALDYAGIAASAREAAREAIAREVGARAADVRRQADSAAEEARRRAREEGARLVAEAERQADTLRAQARALAATARQAASDRADSLVARAPNPAARIAARAAADRLRREADQQAERAIRDADARAESLVARARERAGTAAPAAPPP